MRIKKLPTWLVVLLASIVLAIILAAFHPKGAIISFDEGFHGGAVLFLREMIRYLLPGGPAVPNPIYLLNDFFNGFTLYPPLWTLVAAGMSFILGPSTEVFRMATSLFYVVSVMLVYWFISFAQKSQKAGLICAAVLATMPMVMIYSHLMMREVPQLLGVSVMVVAFYLVVMDVLPRNKKVIIFLAIVFLLAPLNKLPVVALAWMINVTFMILSSLLFFRQKLYRQFLKPELLLYFLLSFLSIGLFILWEEKYLQTNMIDFFRGQSAPGQKDNFLIYTIQTAWSHKGFYLRDFRHIPVLSFIWFGSTAAYFLWKRSTLSFLLVVWTFVIYAAFSGVIPQVPQYILPIYLPLALASGLLIFEVSNLLKPAKSSLQAAVLLTLLLVTSQVLGLKKSEPYFWRTDLTGQEEAAALLVSLAKPGERVLSWHDGNRYAVRVADLNKNLQIMGATQQVCPAAMLDSYEWAIDVKQPPTPSATDQQILGNSPWKSVGTFGSKVHPTVLYRNQSAPWPLIIAAGNLDQKQVVLDDKSGSGKAYRMSGKEEQPTLWGCYRILPLGQIQANFRIRSLSIPSNLQDSEGAVKLEYSAYPGGEYASTLVTVGQLRRTEDYQDFSIEFLHAKLGLQGEFRAFLLQPVEILLENIDVSSQ